MSNENKIVAFQAVPAGAIGFKGGDTHGGIVALGENGQIWWMSGCDNEWHSLPDLPSIANKLNRVKSL